MPCPAPQKEMFGRHLMFLPIIYDNMFANKIKKQRYQKKQQETFGSSLLLVAEIRLNTWDL